MTTDSDAGKQRAIAYLKRSLQLNPMYDSERIVRYRAKALGLSKKRREDVVAANTSRREKILQRIDAVRAACWTESVEPLITQLDKLPLEDQPDLQRTARRLRVILSNRSRLPELANHRHFDAKFLECFKKILTLPQRELAIPREQVIASFRKRKLRKRGMKMIKLLEREVPELCQLEQGWLDSLKRQKVNRDLLVSSKSSDDASGDTSGSGVSWWVIWIAIMVIVRVLRAIATN